MLIEAAMLGVGAVAVWKAVGMVTEFAPLPTEPEQNSPTLKPGDHIRVPCDWSGATYDHHGIFAMRDGLPSVIHFCSDPSGLNLGGGKAAGDKMAVAETTLAAFLAQSVGPIVVVERPRDSDAVVARARSAVGSPGWSRGTYCLMSNNCEHFARWCVGGWGYSSQVVTFSLLRNGMTHAVRVLLGTGMITALRAASILGIGAGLASGLDTLLMTASVGYSVVEIANGCGLFCNGNRETPRPKVKEV